ncbi:hypothetical protein CDO73_01270 [Saccharibacillus sp. O23]|nr:hypothetical protein CDO73_01270 [Saccharibacillus sp. O23]
MLRKADFFYGALLSDLTSKKITPVILSSTDVRRIYLLDSDKGTFKVFTKYVSSPTNKNQENKRLWQFNFSSEEIKEIHKLKEFNESVKFVLICAHSQQWNKSEIAILDLDQVIKCLHLDYVRENHHIMIRSEKSGRGLCVYGTGVSSDKAIKIERDYSKHFIQNSLS